MKKAICISLLIIGTCFLASCSSQTCSKCADNCKCGTCECHK